MAKPYPKEFRDDVVAAARKGQASLSQIAKDFGISEGSLANWMKQADIEDGKRSGLTDDERKQLREASKRFGPSSRRTRSCAGPRPTCGRRTCRENGLPARP